MYKMSSLAVALLLVGCGGDESDSSGNLRVYSPQPTINIVGDAMAPLTADITFDSKGGTSQQIYVGVASESPLVSNAEIVFTSDTGGILEIDLEPGYKAGNGTTQHQVFMLACFDEYCNKHVPGSPIKTTINYSVELNEQAILLEDDTIQYHAATNALVDNNLKQRTIRLSGNYGDQLKISRSNDEVRLNQLSLAPKADDEYAALIDLKLPHNLAVGDYSGDLELNVCYDEQCNYPVAGSPLQVPMDFVIEEPTQTASHALAVGERLNLGFDVLQAAYIPGLNLLVMTSDSPSNQLYVHDLATGETQSFSLADQPKSLTVDTLAKQGRVVVATEYQAEVFDFDSTGLATPTRQQIPTSFNAPSIAVRRDDLFAASSQLEVIDIATKISEISDGVSWSSSTDIKLSRNGDVLLALKTSGTPQSFSALFVESEQWNLRITEDEYHGEYNPEGIFWFDKAGEHYIDGNGNYYTLKDGKHLNMKWVGKLPLSESEYSGHRQPITTFIDTGNEYIIAEGNRSHHNRILRIIDKLSNNVIETFDAETREGYSKEEYIQFAFVADGGEIYLLQAFQDSYTGWDYSKPELVRVK